MPGLRNIQTQVSWIDRKGLELFMGNDNRCMEQMFEHNCDDGY